MSLLVILPCCGFFVALMYSRTVVDEGVVYRIIGVRSSAKDEKDRRAGREDTVNVCDFRDLVGDRVGRSTDPTRKESFQMSNVTKAYSYDRHASAEAFKHFLFLCRTNPGCTIAVGVIGLHSEWG